MLAPGGVAGAGGDSLGDVGEGLLAGSGICC